jgi:NAD(P)-dependent dehydrogenase (short-subunit alcohol dehydrogenase family)
MSLLKDKVAVVTGGSDGIGLATAERFAQEGARVVIAARRQAQLDKAVDRIGHDALGVRTDTSVATSLDELFDTVGESHGRVDVLFVNAAIADAVALVDLDEAYIDRTLAVNVKGMALTVQRALPLLSDGASVILSSSIDNDAGGPGRSVYAATKAAARNFARSWMLELVDRGVRVNAVAPGSTATPGLAKLVGTDDVDGLDAAMGSQIPRGTLIRPDEVAAAVTFLASDLASGVNGIELPVDGGFGQAR